MNFSREWFAVGRVLGNSLNMRSKIQYALAQTRWLVMEGTRSESIPALCEDTVFIARKLGFDSVRIQLEDEERTWRITPDNGNPQRRFLHPLPSHRFCFIELGVVHPEAGGEAANGGAAGSRSSITRTSLVASRQTNGNGATPDGLNVGRECSILSELLAEAWAKAMAAWQNQNQLPPRFDGQETPVSEPRPREIAGAELETI